MPILLESIMATLNRYNQTEQVTLIKNTSFGSIIFFLTVFKDANYFEKQNVLLLLIPIVFP